MYLLILLYLLISFLVKENQLSCGNPHLTAVKLFN